MRLDDRVAPVIALALIGSLAVVVDLGCNRALDAADHHDDDVRARETAEILADIFKMKKKVAFTDNLIPMGEPELLIAEINEKNSAQSLALVGHEPHLSTLVSMLTAGSRQVDIKLKKGGVCYLSADDLHQEHRATLEWLLTPGILVEIADK